MKVRRRFLLPATLVATIASSIVLLGIGAAAAFAATATEKQALFELCFNNLKTASNFVSCCKLAGGAVQVEYDAAGNIVSASCLIHSDEVQFRQPLWQHLLSDNVGDLFVPAPSGGNYLIRLGVGLTGPPVVYIPPSSPPTIG